jgi:hypothetical protein
MGRKGREWSMSQVTSERSLIEETPEGETEHRVDTRPALA